MSKCIFHGYKICFFEKVVHVYNFTNEKNLNVNLLCFYKMACLKINFSNLILS